MKKVIPIFYLLLIALFSSTTLLAQAEKEDYYKIPNVLVEHLGNLNNQWLKPQNLDGIPDQIKQELACFETHEQLIKKHLALVEYTLRKRSVTHLTPFQKVKRNEALDVLNTYWNVGVFPINKYHNKQTPYFIDDFNTACAVGHIMRETDALELASTIAETCNYAYISEMPFQKELADWAYNSGFTVDELKWIQPSYGPQLIFVPSVNEPSCGSADGSLDVEVIAGDWYWGQTPVEELLYVWDNGGEGTTLHNIEAGVYCLSVFDVPPPPDPSIGSDPVLVMDKCFTVNNDSSFDFTGTVNHETCPDALDGSIKLSISDNDYTINWYNDQWEIVGSGDAISGLAGFPMYGIIYNGINQNIYHAEVISGLGCKAYKTFGISTTNENPYIFISSSSVIDASCGGADGYAEVIHDPGVSILWSDGSTNPIRNNLSLGTYTIVATNTAGCTYEYNFEMAEECPAQECNTDWFEPNDFNCGLAEYITEDGAYIYITTLSPLIADAPSNVYDCEGNYLCFVGGFPMPEPSPGDCNLHDEINFSNITFVRTVVECPNFDCNIEWFEQSDIYCTLKQYSTSNGATIYSVSSSDLIADGGINYYDCEGNFLCFSGGFPTPEPSPYQCNQNNLVDFNDLTYIGTLADCQTNTCNTSWFTQNDSTCSLDEYVTADGTIIFVAQPSPLIADLPTVYYDCEGNFLCHAGGYYMPPLPSDECSMNNAVDFTTLAFVQTVIPCNQTIGGVCNTNWFTPDDLQCNLKEYLTPFGVTIFVSEPSSIVADGTTNYYSCEGNLVCYTGGIAGVNTCEGIFDIESLAYVQTIVNCQEPCNDLSWAESLINNDCICRVDQYVDAEGNIIIFADSDCNFIDDADSYYDCSGNWLCATNGELMPESYCDGSFLDNLTFQTNLFSCEPTDLSCNGIAHFSIQVRALLEGTFDGFGMNTDLLDTGLLPYNQPYNTAPWNYLGTEQMTVLTPDIVDWVMLCLRNADGELVESQAAIINADGDLLNAVSNDCIVFPEANVFESYYISIHHRGHLSVISSQMVSDETYYDFTSSMSQAQGVEPMKNVNGNWVLFGGDYDNNGIINNLDFNNWFGNGAAVNQYIEIDIDGNGIVNNLDYNVWEINRSKVGFLNLDNNIGN